MLNSEAQQKLVDATIEPPRLFQDPILGGSRVVYRKIIRTLFRKGLVLFEDAEVSLHVLFLSIRSKVARAPRETNRHFNRHFNRPPSAALASPEALAGLECSADSRFWISTVDVRDAFHCMALPDDLSDCFALPRSTSREVRCLQAWWEAAWR